MSIKALKCFPYYAIYPKTKQPQKEIQNAWFTIIFTHKNTGIDILENEYLQLPKTDVFQKKNIIFKHKLESIET